jgi:cytochrome c6
MRRPARALAVLFGAGALAVALAGCGGEKNATATPRTVIGATTPAPTETTAPTGPKGNAVAGKAVFNGSAGCRSCHTLKDAGATGTVGPNLDQAMPSDALVIDRVTNGRGAMPSFKGSLTAQQIADVAAYVSSVAGK